MSGTTMSATLMPSGPLGPSKANPLHRQGTPGWHRIKNLRLTRCDLRRSDEIAVGLVAKVYREEMVQAIRSSDSCNYSMSVIAGDRDAAAAFRREYLIRDRALRLYFAVQLVNTLAKWPSDRAPSPPSLWPDPWRLLETVEMADRMDRADLTESGRKET